MRWALALSIIIHAFLILCLAYHRSVLPPPHPPIPVSGGSLDITLVPITPEIEKEIVSSQSEGSSSNEETKFCNDKSIQYSGIGVTYSTSSWIIIEAPPSYPAYKAGIRKGDYFKNPGVQPDEDGYQDVYVERDNQELHFRIKEEKICYQNS